MHRRRPRVVFDGDVQETTQHLFRDPLQRHRDQACANDHPAATPEHYRDLSVFGYRPLAIDGTCYFGAREDPVLMRLQDKTTDRRNPDTGRLVALPPEQCRTRIELQLSGGAPQAFGFGLPANFEGLADRSLPEETRGKSFEQFSQEAFRFAIPTIPGDDPMRAWKELEVFRRGGVAALDLYQRARFRHDRIDRQRALGRRQPVKELEERGYRRAWTDLTRKCKDALRDLVRKWDAGARR
jgi:hypothetical protein